MKATITLQLADGGSEALPFKACATTPVRYRQIFGKELMASLTALLDALSAEEMAGLLKADGAEAAALEENPETYKALIKIVGSGELDSVSKLAFIMNRQAEKADMAGLSFEDYLDWLDRFESMEFLTHAMDFIALYMGNRRGSSVPKKGAAQPSGS